MTEQQIVNKERVSNHGEVFTARREVEAMLDLVKNETEKIDSTFLEPACGTGNFLIAILERKLAAVERILNEKEKLMRKSEKRHEWKSTIYNTNSLKAISSIYGIDILQDSIEFTQKRLFNYYCSHYHKIVGFEPSIEIINAVKFILKKNILLGDAINFKDNVTIPGVPGFDEIIFTEWKFQDDEEGLVKRQEFRFSSLHKSWSKVDNNSLLLEDDCKIQADDNGTEKIEVCAIREYPLTHYSNLK